VAVIVLASVVVGSAVAAPAFYHVDPGGSDGASGSAAAPWETLQHAVDSVGPGDTIIVNPGTYAGMRIETSGAPGTWITLRAAYSGTVTIDEPGPKNRHDSNIEIESWDGDRTVSHWIVEGLEVTGAPNWGIDVRGNPAAHSHHITLRGNEVHHNGVGSIKTGIFFAFTDRAKAIENESHHNGEHGIYLSNGGDDFVVKRNHLHDNERCGLHMNGDLSQGGDGLISDGVVDGNWIESNGAEGCAGVNMDGVTDTVVSNNVIVENHASGITMFKQDGAKCSRRNRVINNTVVQAADGRWAIVVGGPGCVDNTIRNNVLLTRHDFRGAIEMPTAAVPGLDSDYNIVVDRFTADDGNSVITLSQWQAATGQDTHSIVASIDEVFIPGRYRHEPGGVAEDGGAADGSSKGYDNVARSAGDGSDIGAFETPYCRGSRATIIGSRGKDILVGSGQEDVIAGLAGRDTIRGKGGGDTICAGSGADEARGGAGPDLLVGNRGADQLLGGDGDDTLKGNRGDDVLRGNGGDDTANGGPGTDDCRGETKLACE